MFGFQQPLPLLNKQKEELILYNPLHIDESTFKGGQEEPAHNWFRLTPSFGPKLVDYMLNYMNYEDGKVVLDPFAGASTTLIQCKRKKIPSVGIEINPFLFFVGNASLSWNLNISDLINQKTVIEREFIKKRGEFQNKSVEQLEIPKIHNPYRWWRDDVLRDILCLKTVIKSKCDPDFHDFFILGLMCVLIPNLSNVTLGRLQLHFINRSNTEIDVMNTYIAKINRMINDMRLLNKYSNIPSLLYQGDSTKLTDSIKKHVRVDYVVTSPPYPNRYSYVWNTRPHLYLFDFFSTAKEAADLDKSTIGGTWGTATSSLKNVFITPISPVLDKYHETLINEIREKDNLMANYVMKYFNLIYKQIIEMNDILNQKSKVAYVVGNSWIKDIYIETDKIIASIFKETGYSNMRVERFRKRNSGINLYESIVFAEKY